MSVEVSSEEVCEEVFEEASEEVLEEVLEEVFEEGSSEESPSEGSSSEGISEEVSEEASEDISEGTSLLGKEDVSFSTEEVSVWEEATPPVLLIGVLASPGSLPQEAKRKRQAAKRPANMRLRFIVFDLLYRDTASRIYTSFRTSFYIVPFPSPPVNGFFTNIDRFLWSLF